MKGIKAILSENGIDEAAAESIEKAVNENYRTIDEVRKKAGRIDELEAQNKELSSQIAELEGDGEEIERLRKQVSAFEDAEAERKSREEEDERRNRFRETFDAVVGERAFANDLVRESVFERVYGACRDDMGKGVQEALDSLTKDVPGIWDNPQGKHYEMPGQGQVSNNSSKGDAKAISEIASFMFRKER